MTVSILPHKATAQGQDPKIGIFLSGGGALGFAHIGMLQALEEAGISPQYVCGASMGALIGVFYSAGFTPFQIKEIILKEKLYKKEKLFSLSGMTYKGSSISSHKKVRGILERHLGEKGFEDLDKHFMVAVSNISDSRTEVVDAGPGLIDYLLASMAIPAVFEPVMIGGKIYVDGGAFNHFPVDKIRGSVDILIGLDVMPRRDSVEIRSIRDAMVSTLHSLAIVSGERGRQMCDFVVDCGAVNFYQALEFEMFEQIYNYGYETMRHWLDQHPELLHSCSSASATL